jgi:hypothetical protein
MISRPYARRGSITRGLYAFVVLCAPLIAAFLFVLEWAGYARQLANPIPLPWFEPSPPYYASAITLLGFMFPGFRAWVRVIRGGELIPAWRFDERPVVAAMVALSCGFACLVAFLVTSVLGDVLTGQADDVGGPLMFFFVLMGMAAAIGLLVGECVLVGRDTSSQKSRGVS